MHLLEENRTKFLDNKVKKDYLDYLIGKLEKISHIFDIEKMMKESEEFKQDNHELKKKCHKYKTLVNNPPFLLTF